MESRVVRFHQRRASDISLPAESIVTNSCRAACGPSMLSRPKRKDTMTSSRRVFASSLQIARGAGQGYCPFCHYSTVILEGSSIEKVK